MQKELSVEIGDALPGEGRIRRSILSPGELVSSPIPGVNTVYDILQYSVKTYGDSKPCIGYRKVLSVVEEEKEVPKPGGGVEKKMWKYFQLSAFNWFNYTEVSEITRTIGSGLFKLGMRKNSRLEIFANTSANWMMMCHGCFTQSFTIVTAYDTLGEEGLLHSMNESEIVALFTNADLLPIVANVAAKCPTLKNVIYDGEPKAKIISDLQNTYPSIGFYTLDELKRLGKDYPVQPNPPTREDFACIMYTSGSTGNPKGVLLSHGNIVSVVGAVNRMFHHLVRNDDVLLAYLPLAHVLEFAVEQVAIFWGAALGYGNVRTLTDVSVRNCLGDIRELRPTLMTGVPQVWETIRKGVLSKVNSGSPTVQKIFNAAFKAKSFLLSRGMSTKILDNIVFNKIKQQTGGRLRFALSGGAPISRETQEFLTITLCPILQGYGMTETCGVAAILSPDHFDLGTVGAPAPCVEIKLVDVPEAGYHSTNPRPQGEVWIRGPGIARGYYKNEKVTKETFTEDGWLKTGDIGEWTPSGTLTIIDRKKNLVKLAHGEYIALEKLESLYKSCTYVHNIMVYADAFQNKPVAVVHPVEAQIRHLAVEKGLDAMDFEQLCGNKEIVVAVLQSLHAQAKKAGLKPAEMLQAVALTHQEWTPQNGLLTAAQKLKRKDLVDRYRRDIDILYGK